jgi:hypothetical protein
LSAQNSPAPAQPASVVHDVHVTGKVPQICASSTNRLRQKQLLPAPHFSPFSQKLSVGPQVPAL